MRYPRLWVVVPTADALTAEQVAANARNSGGNVEAVAENVGGLHRARAKFATEQNAEQFETSMSPAFPAYRPLFVDDVVALVGRIVSVSVMGSIKTARALHVGRLDRIDDETLEVGAHRFRIDQVAEIVPR